MHTAARWLAVLCLGVLAGCAGQAPRPPAPAGLIDADHPPRPSQAVVLIALRGPQAVEGLRLCRRYDTCLDYRFAPQRDAVLALAVPVPSEGLEIFTVTPSGGPGGAGEGTAVAGLSYGHQYVNDDPTEVSRPGVYYHVLLDNAAGTFDSEPTESILRRAWVRYGALLRGLTPRNFEWPRPEAGPDPAPEPNGRDGDRTDEP